jgi:DNA-binding transcriptional LysR family regulator
LLRPSGHYGVDNDILTSAKGRFQVRRLARSRLVAAGTPAAERREAADPACPASTWSMPPRGCSPHLIQVSRCGRRGGILFGFLRLRCFDIPSVIEAIRTTKNEEFA